MDMWMYLAIWLSFIGMRIFKFVEIEAPGSMGHQEFNIYCNEKEVFLKKIISFIRTCYIVSKYNLWGKQHIHAMQIQTCIDKNSILYGLSQRLWCAQWFINCNWIFFFFKDLSTLITKWHEATLRYEDSVLN